MIKDAESQWSLSNKKTNELKIDTLISSDANASSSNDDEHSPTIKNGSSGKDNDSGLYSNSININSEFEKYSKSCENINSTNTSDHTANSSPNHSSDNIITNKHNGRVKIVHMRNTTNHSNNNNINSMSSSSTSSLQSADIAKENTNINSNSNNVNTNNQKTNMTRSNSANFFKSNANSNNSNINNNNISTININNPQSSNNMNNSNKKSMAFNNGANIQEDNCMFFYGSRSIEILDIKLELNIINQVTAISFHYIDYDDYLSKNFSRIKHKFPNVNVS
jgi:hypothetical protein